MDRRTLTVAAVAVVVVGAGAVVAIGPGDFFLPEQTTEGDGTTLTTATENAGQSDGNGSDAVSDDATILASGSFVGVQGHDVSGTVSLVESNGSLYLQFRNYQQTSGPDVFIYVTPSDEPTTSDAVEAGTKVKIDGGEDGGESTKTGTFVQKLPESVSAEDVEGIAVWCDQFSVPFGYADLTESG